MGTKNKQADTITPIERGKVVWHESTRNHHHADLGEGLTIEVVRSPSWRRLGHDKPWRIVLFGNPHNRLPRRGDLSDAMDDAEREGLALIAKAATRMGMSEAMPNPR